MQQSSAVLTGVNYQPPTQSQISEAVGWIERFAEHWRKPDDFEALRDLMQPDTRNLIPPMPTPADREGVIAYFRQALERLPDLKLTVLRWAPVADAVLVEWEASATVAGKHISWRGVDRVCLLDGRTYEGQVYWDTRGVAQTIAEAAESLER